MDADRGAADAFGAGRLRANRLHAADRDQLQHPADGVHQRLLLQLGQDSPLAPQVFDLTGLAFPAWALAAFTISVCAGALIRRTIPAIVAVIAAWSGLLAAVVFWLRSHYEAALTGAGLVTPEPPRLAAPWSLSQNEPWSVTG